MIAGSARLPAITGSIALALAVTAGAFADAATAVAAGGAGTAQSTHWSGYVQPGRNITAAAAEWQVSQGRIMGRSDAQVATWIGIGGWGSEAQNRNIVQIGTIAIVQAHGKVDQRVWYELDPPPHYVLSDVSVHSGDHIAASVRAIGRNRWRLSLHDLTSGGSFSLTHRFHSLGGSAEAVVEDPYDNGESSPYSSEAFPFPRFAPVRFHAIRLRIGSTWQAFSPEHASAVRLVQYGRLLAEPTALRGDGFSVHERR